MSLQKYIAQHISQDTGQPNGARRMLFGPESVYLAKDVDAALAAERQANAELAMRERKAEADLADAQHALLLANSNAAAFQRVVETNAEALRWVLQHGVVMAIHHIDGKPHPKLVDNGDYDSMTPPEHLRRVLERAVSLTLPAGNGG